MAIVIVVSPALWIPFVQRRHYGGIRPRRIRPMVDRWFCPVQQEPADLSKWTASLFRPRVDSRTPGA